MSERDDEQRANGDATIARAAIYPAIGVARLGNIKAVRPSTGRKGTSVALSRP